VGRGPGGCSRGRRLAERRSRSDEPVRSKSIERFLGVRRQFKCADVVENLVELAFFQVEFMQCRADGLAGRWRRRRCEFDYIQRAGLAGSQPDDVARRNRKSDDALADSVEINPHWLGRLLTSWSRACCGRPTVWFLG